MLVPVDARRRRNCPPRRGRPILDAPCVGPHSSPPPLLIFTVACGDSPQPNEPAPTAFVAKTPEEAKQVALKSSGALLGTLVKRLTDELRTNEPHEALDVCAAEAQEITRNIRDEYGVTIRRTALRYRNPKNKPDAYERAWMEAALKRDDVNPAGESQVIKAPDGSRELRFVRPLTLQQLCTECHGPKASLSPQVIAALEKHYPDDRAVGFVPGDLRGIVSVRVPLAAE